MASITIRKLDEAIKFAREQANLTEVTDHEIGRPILEYIFAPA